MSIAIMYCPAVFALVVTLLYVHFFSRTTWETHHLGLLQGVRQEIRQAPNPQVVCTYWLEHTPRWVSTTSLVQDSWQETREWCAWLTDHHNP